MPNNPKINASLNSIISFAGTIISEFEYFLIFSKRYLLKTPPPVTIVCPSLRCSPINILKN